MWHYGIIAKIVAKLKKRKKNPFKNPKIKLSNSTQTSELSFMVTLSKTPTFTQ